MSTPDEISQMIKDVEARESKLTDWERQFIDSISRQEQPLSNRQDARLEDIWNRVTS